MKNLLVRRRERRRSAVMTEATKIQPLVLGSQGQRHIPLMPRNYFTFERKEIGNSGAEYTDTLCSLCTLYALHTYVTDTGSKREEEEGKEISIFPSGGIKAYYAHLLRVHLKRRLRAQQHQQLHQQQQHGILRLHLLLSALKVRRRLPHDDFTILLLLLHPKFIAESGSCTAVQHTHTRVYLPGKSDGFISMELSLEHQQREGPPPPPQFVSLLMESINDTERRVFVAQQKSDRWLHLLTVCTHTCSVVIGSWNLDRVPMNALSKQTNKQTNLANPSGFG